MSKTKIGASILATAAAGSAVLGGVALASGSDSYAGSGTGGAATNNCLNIGVDVLSGIGLGGTGVASGASCAADASGTGGSAF
ncbi:MAG: hypothetical protein ACT4O0_06035 [Pseudonocardia sp.]